MSSAGWILRRVTQLILTLFLASIIVFSMIYLAPGDPATFLGGGRPLSPEAMAVIREKYHLDASFIEQYARWLGGFFVGNLGESLTFRQPVVDLLASRALTTLMLVVPSLILTVVLGVALGASAALRGKVARVLTTLVVSVGSATPVFITAIVLVWLFAVQLKLLPSGGNGSGFPDQIRYMILPVLALTFTFLATLARVSESAIRKEASREHVTMARSKGLPDGTVFRSHILWNSFIPIATISGMVAAGLIAGTTVVETAFGLSGIGSLLIKAVETHDAPLTQAVVLIMVAAFVVVNAIVDMLYGVFDPRIKTGAKS